MLDNLLAFVDGGVNHHPLADIFHVMEQPGVSGTDPKIDGQNRRQDNFPNAQDVVSSLITHSGAGSSV